MNRTREGSTPLRPFYLPRSCFSRSAELGRGTSDTLDIISTFTAMDERSYTPEELEIKALRVEIDAVKQKVKKLADQRPAKGGAELTLSFRSLQQAKHWLGECLGEMGSPLPAVYADKAE